MSEDGDREALRYHLIRADLSPEELERPVNRIAGTRLVSDKAPLPLAERRRASRASPTAHRACAQQRPARARGRGRFTAPFGEGNWCRRNGRPRSDAPMARRRCRGSRTLRISEPTGTTLMPAQQPTIVSSVVDWFTAPTLPAPSRSGGDELGAEVVAVLTERIAQLRRLDDSQTGGLLLDWVSQLAAPHLIRSCYRAGTVRRSGRIQPTRRPVL